MKFITFPPTGAGGGAPHSWYAAPVRIIYISAGLIE